MVGWNTRPEFFILSNPSVQEQQLEPEEALDRLVDPSRKHPIFGN